VTIACVSNQVGGDLVGNAAWRGVELRRVLDMAGVQSQADQLVGRSVDGFTVGMPVEWVKDTSRTPMIAVGMNGAPLPRVHGYPARLIVPGLYGYVSATKWVTELQLTTFDNFSAYWVPLGWAQKAPILSQSRIDVPPSGSSVRTGQVPVAGVAWAPDRGIRAVEVSIDGGDWQPTRLSTPISKATWVQWLYDWDAPAGSHTIEVRATDGAGEVQTADRSEPAPDGARGHHTIAVSVG
jgi:DMSO/TMAO reductase YedYZ molybdopterin-dependent catalytic subunit